jgi:hypothetical protein
VGDPLRDGDFWKGPLEAALYLEMAHRNPRREGEAPLAYVARLSEATQAEIADDAQRTKGAA